MFTVTSGLAWAVLVLVDVEPAVGVIGDRQAALMRLRTAMTRASVIAVVAACLTRSGMGSVRSRPGFRPFVKVRAIRGLLLGCDCGCSRTVGSYAAASSLASWGVW